jgi:lysylphosphatidylglycerol synthetase-like protein (DUF2156 family)
VGAALGLTAYPGFDYGQPLPSAITTMKAVIDMVVVAVQALGPLAAIILISFVRGVGAPERVSVWLLALAATAPLGPVFLGYGSGESMYLYPSALAFALAAVLIVVAVGLRRPEPARPRARWGMIAAATAGVAMLAGAALTLATVGWLTRTPLVTTEPVGSHLYEEWLWLKTTFEAQVDALLQASVIAAVVIVVAVAVVGITHRAFDLRTAVVAAVFVIVFGYVQLSQYLGLWLPTMGVTEGNPAVLTILRLALVTTVFIAVDGVPHPRRATSTQVA